MHGHNSSVLHAKNVAVITGGASGIGLAAAHKYATIGMHVVLVDIDDKAIEQAVKEIKAVDNVGEVWGMKVDVSRIDDVVALREKVLDEFGEVHVLMANAGIGRPTPAMSTQVSLGELQTNWSAVLQTNMFGVINVGQAFAPYMAQQENPSVIINTGSKQGITCPPGNAGYNLSKAGVKVFTEQLAHELRSIPSNCSAHLFVPGWVWTPLAGQQPGKDKPNAPWTAEQTVDYMIEKVFDNGDFYVICPDNEVTSALDKARVAWSLGDILENRPALSRWHPSCKSQSSTLVAARALADQTDQARYDEFVNQRQGLQPRSRSRGRPIDRVPEEAS